MITAGTILQQRYRVDNQIGQGGMGAVYVATDERFGSTVAIKETLYMDDNYRKAIEREARLLNSLKHNALPRVTDHFEEENSQFLVMEYVAGEDLSTIIEREKRPFPVDKVLDWADQLLDALDFLHNQVTPVIHRDIKPQNLKLTPDGRIVLLDFGLAKGNPTDAGNQTAAKSIFGYSRNYASLEQIQGTGTDPRSDIYSLAATLYHLVTGSPPEDALTRAMNVLSQRPDPLMPANVVRPEIPAGVAGVLEQCLDLNAAGRPATAKDARAMFRQPEAYARPTRSNFNYEAAPTGTVHAQPTRLMSEGTRADGQVHTDVKTEVLGFAASDPTAVRTSDSHASGAVTEVHPSSLAPRTRKRSGIAAVIATLALMCIGVVGGIYLAFPALFGASVEVPSAPANVAPVDNSNSSLAIDPTVEPASNASAAVPAAGEPARSKTSNTALSRPASGRNGPEANNGVTFATGDGSVTMDDPDDPSTIVITKKNPNGTVTTTRIHPKELDRLDNETTPRIPNSRIPDLSGLKELTPEQRARVKKAIRMGRVPVPPEQPQKNSPDDQR